ncbi:LacI family DNA-binding transcriptional regulator [Bifidobacterium sp. 82T10]|uniref:LacI family DNA-binding transcriptional regulator n=1 Tax=Bifidobacterium miconis TaxID=2834435 RepID=A0ABS6WGH7_9BIFI|nr:LacI family DNA-binding transcriptional regulator [Bifidobacterium miconis]MBW3093151.1 LacI family DNA-binding transcriptional regulator [Bifidobacterium miconis]
MAEPTKVTMRDVAKAAGVSAMAASYALRNKPGVSEATRRRVVEAAETLNYRINTKASALKTGKSGTIGILIDDFDDPFWSRLIAHIYDAATGRGVLPIFQQAHSMRERAEEGLVGAQGFGQYCDGMIVATGGLNAEEVRTLTLGKPTVLFGYEGRANVLSAVNPPNEDGMRAAVEHLIDRGCRRIGFVGMRYLDDRGMASANSSNDKRTRGALTAMIDHGLAYDERSFFPCRPDERGGRSAADKIMERLASEPGCFDGFACNTDTNGVGLIGGLTAGGVRIPEDVKVIGFNGTRPAAFTQPSLSTISIDFAQLADMAVSLLLETIDADTPSRAVKVISGYTLEQRESTA